MGTKMFFLLCVVLSFIGISQAQVFGLGKCAQVKTQDNLDLNKYLGTWYEIYKFKSNFEGSQKCVSANYQLKSDGHVRVDNIGYENGEKKEAIGDAYIPDPSYPSRLGVRFSNLAPYGRYWVLDTDYTTHTMIYSCTDILGIFHISYAWILSRERTLDEAVKNRLFAKAESFGIKTSNFLKEDQTGCQ
ncbi:apolipoprotein D-like [Crassostrea virginica]|uniref:Apolipoprotein D n=1 Tax=Crassostrea virginica TaxID=6565 RepID=A0A8B8EX93_CRAVI|nr:apolipoprotein D-like [Crassostrea virginica]